MASLQCMVSILMLVVAIEAGRNVFRSPNFTVIDMIEMKGIRVQDNLGQTQLVKSFQKCVDMCLSLSSCLSFNFARLKADEHLCHATRYNYTDAVSLSNPDTSNLSTHYAYNDRAKSAPKVAGYSCDQQLKSAPGLQSGIYSVKVNNTHSVNAFCKMEHVLPRCIFSLGDGTGGSDVKQRGSFATREDCILQCAKQKRFNGVTIDSRYGTQCWCEEKMTGRNTNDLYESCIFEGELQIDGWLEVARLSTSANWPFALEEAESSDINKLQQVTTGKFALTSEALSNLRDGTNFTHIRFNCYKPSQGRTIDLVANNSKVIDWLLGYSNVSVRPASCGSFYILPTDNSETSPRCAEWGQKATWGSDASIFAHGKLLWAFPFFIYGQVHWYFNNNVYASYKGYYLCDDWAPQTSGTWRIFVK